jgi:DNA-binding CsgD family transcriptional regulator
MQCKRWKVLIYCQDDALKNYFLNALSLCDDIEILFPPPPAEPVDAEIVVDGYLTPTEVLRLQQLVDHGSIKKAAERACISERTFNNQLGWIRAKLGVSSTQEAVLWALKHGIVRLDSG